MNYLLTDAAFCLLYLLLCLPGLRRRTTGERRALLAGLAFIVAWTVVPSLARLHLVPRLPGHYNWSGKLLELAVDGTALLFLLGPAGWSRQELGLQLDFAPGTGRAITRYLLPLLLLELVVLGLIVPAERPTWEDYFFQLTLPGLTEELAWRSILLALLDRAFPPCTRVLGAYLGWGAVVTSLLFGLDHGLEVDAHWRVSLDLAPMAIPLVGGFVLVWCRARSGSILLPLLVHSGMNEVANLVGLVKVLAARRA